MSTVPLTPAQPPAGAAGPTGRHAPRRGVLVAALVVAVVLLVGSVGATAVFVHTHSGLQVTRVQAPNGRTFVFPGPGRDGQPSQNLQGPRNGSRHPGMPMGPGRESSPTPTPSPSPSAG